jgi:hypothetical protein
MVNEHPYPLVRRAHHRIDRMTSNAKMRVRAFTRPKRNQCWIVELRLLNFGISDNLDLNPQFADRNRVPRPGHARHAGHHVRDVVILLRWVID